MLLEFVTTRPRDLLVGGWGQLFFQLKERCQAKFLEGHFNELGLLIGPHKTARFVWANQEA